MVRGPVFQAPKKYLKINLDMIRRLRNSVSHRRASNPPNKTKMKSYKCTDGFLTKTLKAKTAQAAAEAYAIVTTLVTVVEVDSEDNEIGTPEKIEVTI